MTDTLHGTHATGLSAYDHARREGADGAPLVVTLHGTGADETQLHGLAGELMPEAHVISPRGDVSESGALRFFRRRAEGVYDMDDLARATEKMAGFLAAARTATGVARVIGLGYSNGANVLAATSFDHPDVVDDMVLMHPLIPWRPAPRDGFSGRRVLITAGRRDPIAPAVQTDALALALERAGAAVTLQWHEGGHEVAESEVAAIRAFLG